ncbi:MAG: thioredoxin [Flavobacteriales bacterium]|nr:thioredoxin [Flavobacteriales bacterium]
MPTVQMTTQDFKDKVFDYTTSKEWVFKGDKPAIIDFYADWCQPCKMIAPILEKLSDKYGDDLVIYKVDTESEMELSQVFGIRSIPTMLFIPVGKQPMIQPGALPENVLEEVIEKELLPTTTEA